MTCASCGKTLKSANPRARYCNSGCRANATRKRAQALPALHTAPEPVEVSHAVAEATLAELSAAGRESTALGTAALALAARIDVGADTGSALASAVKQLGATMAEALQGVRGSTSLLDELRARRDAKRGA
jgi:hypothetical protein